MKFDLTKSHDESLWEKNDDIFLSLGKPRNSGPSVPQPPFRTRPPLEAEKQPAVEFQLCLYLTPAGCLFFPSGSCASLSLAFHAASSGSDPHRFWWACCAGFLTGPSYTGSLPLVQGSAWVVDQHLIM